MMPRAATSAARPSMTFRAIPTPKRTLTMPVAGGPRAPVVNPVLRTASTAFLATHGVLPIVPGPVPVPVPGSAAGGGGGADAAGSSGDVGSGGSSGSLPSLPDATDSAPASTPFVDAASFSLPDVNAPHPPLPTRPLAVVTPTTTLLAGRPRWQVYGGAALLVLGVAAVWWFFFREDD